MVDVEGKETGRREHPRLMANARLSFDAHVARRILVTLLTLTCAKLPRRRPLLADVDNDARDIQCQSYHLRDI